MAVHQTVRCQRHARAVRVEQEQRQAALVAGLAAGACQHQNTVRLIAVEHHGLATVQNEAAALLAGLQRGVLRREHTLLFVHRQRQLQVARHQVRQIAGTAGRVGAAQDAAAQHHRGQVRRGHPAATQFFQQDHGFHQAGAQAAVVLVERQRQPSQFGELPPKGLRLVPALHKTARAVGQHLLLIAQGKIHPRSPSVAVTGPVPPWR